jgi:hypothetical protein
MVWAALVSDSEGAPSAGYALSTSNRAWRVDGLAAVDPGDAIRLVVGYKGSMFYGEVTLAFMDSPSR